MKAATGDKNNRHSMLSTWGSGEKRRGGGMIRKRSWSLGRTNTVPRTVAASAAGVASGGSSPSRSTRGQPPPPHSAGLVVVACVCVCVCVYLELVGTRKCSFGSAIDKAGSGSSDGSSRRSSVLPKSFWRLAGVD